jgi:Arm DNA-binding domain
MAGIRTRNKLTALAVDRQRRPGLYADGAGLNLVITDKGVKRWELRTMARGRRRQLGLGIYPKVTLEAARRKAADLRDALRDGVSVPSARQPRPGASAKAATNPVTFRDAFESYFELKSQ